MKFDNFDGYKHAISVVSDVLEMNRSYLAGFLGVTERSLSTWENLGGGETTPKSKRMKLLYNVLKYISENYDKIPSKDYKFILENGRITIDPDDEDDDGTISLINYILSNPDERYWVSCVREAVEGFIEEDYTTGETDRSVHIA